MKTAHGARLPRRLGALPGLGPAKVTVLFSLFFCDR